jgi:hypothetical protein
MAIDTGIGLLLADGDLVFDTTGALALVSGSSALVQDLTVRVLTPLGSDPFDTGYGLDARSVFSQSADARATLDLVRLNLVRTLGTDSRVSEIKDVAVTSGDRRSWTAQVELITTDGARLGLGVTTGA